MIADLVSWRSTGTAVPRSDQDSLETPATEMEPIQLPKEGQLLVGPLFKRADAGGDCAAGGTAVWTWAWSEAGLTNALASGLARVNWGPASDLPIPRGFEADLQVSADHTSLYQRCAN